MFTTTSQLPVLLRHQHMKGVQLYKKEVHLSVKGVQQYFQAVRKAAASWQTTVKSRGAASWQTDVKRRVAASWQIASKRRVTGSWQTAFKGRVAGSCPRCGPTDAKKIVAANWQTAVKRTFWTVLRTCATTVVQSLINKTCTYYTRYIPVTFMGTLILF